MEKLTSKQQIKVKNLLPKGAVLKSAKPVTYIPSGQIDEKGGIEVIYFYNDETYRTVVGARVGKEDY